MIDVHPVHDWRTHTVRHLPVAGRACRLVWHKRLLDCAGGCGTFVERTPSVAPGAVWTRPAARQAVAMVSDNIPVERVRLAFGVGCNTVMRAVTVAAGQVTPPSEPTMVGIDEIVMTPGRLLERRREYLTSLVCLTSGLVVAVAQGRDRAVAADLLAHHAPHAQVIAVDLFTGYLAAGQAVEGATVVADPFHLVRLALHAMDLVRRRRQLQIHGRRGRGQRGEERTERTRSNSGWSGSAAPANTRAWYSNSEAWRVK